MGGPCRRRGMQVSGKHRPVQRCSQHMRSLLMQAAPHISGATQGNSPPQHTCMINQHATRVHAAVQQPHSSSLCGQHCPHPMLTVHNTTGLPEITCSQQALASAAHISHSVVAVRRREQLSAPCQQRPPQPAAYTLGTLACIPAAGVGGKGCSQTQSPPAQAQACRPGTC
jgi:hypothetical protein